MSVERFRRSGPAKGDVVGEAGGGLGLGYEVWDGAIFYGLVNGQISASPDLPDKVLIDTGPSLALLYYVNPNWALTLSSSYYFALDSETDDYFDAHLEQSFTLTHSLALRLSCGLMGDADDPFLDMGVSLNWYL